MSVKIFVLNKISILLLCCTFIQGSIAQNVEADEARTLYPDASAIYLSKKQEYSISVENGTLVGLCNISEKILINKESGLSFQKKSISTNSFVSASKIKAFTLIPGKKKYEKKEVKKIELNDDPGRNNFYDDEKSYSIHYPSVQTGAVLDLSYQLNFSEPRFMGSHYWFDYIPVQENEFVITVDKNVNIEYKLFNCDKENIVFTKEETKKSVIYRWKLNSVKGGMYYSDAPNYRYFEPHIVFYVTNYKVDGKVNQLLGTTNNLYQWYRDLQRNVNKTEDKKLKQIADSLVAGVSSESEKVNKIFYWVQDNISYVAFEDGLGGFVPRDAGLVCTRKFGDCKDMASIINEMLRMAGIPSYLTWIGSRDIPYTYQQVPTPSVDNHMITSYKDKDGNWSFLDATGKHASRELYTSFIQGKEAMIGISADSVVLVTVPVKDTSANQTTDYVNIEIKDNIVLGKGNIVMTGYDQLEYIYSIEKLNKEERINYFKNYFAKGSNKVSFSDIDEVTIDRSSPLTIHYNFKLPDYVRQNQNELYVNLNMDLGWGYEPVIETRSTPVNYKHKTKKRIITTLDVPAGYKPEYIPKNTNFGNEVVGFSSTYIYKENKIILINDFYFNTLILQVADFARYNKVLSEYVKSNKQIVSLIKL